MLLRLPVLFVAGRALSTPLRTVLLTFYVSFTAPESPGITPVVLVLAITQAINRHGKGILWLRRSVYLVIPTGKFFSHGLIVRAADGRDANIGGVEAPRVHEMRFVAEVLHDDGEGFGFGQAVCVGAFVAGLCGAVLDHADASALASLPARFVGDDVFVYLLDAVDAFL
jgi:hypothetical protein